MEVIATGIEGLVEIRPQIFGDNRGFFMESFNLARYEQQMPGLHPFVQDNISKSKKGVLRGLHFQAPPFAQSKLVMVTSGRVQDVVVDLRKDSKTYGHSYSIILDGETKNQLYIPRGFAHGFCVLEDETVFQYKCDNGYSKESERTLMWNDPALNIEWAVNAPLVSEKDKAGTLLKNLETPF